MEYLEKGIENKCRLHAHGFIYIFLLLVSAGVLVLLVPSAARTTYAKRKERLKDGCAQALSTMAHNFVSFNDDGEEEGEESGKRGNSNANEARLNRSLSLSYFEGKKDPLLSVMRLSVPHTRNTQHRLATSKRRWRGRGQYRERVPTL